MIMGYSDENFDRRAPWRDETKRVMVRVTQTLVNDIEVEVPADADEDEIKSRALSSTVTPAMAIVVVTGEEDWYLESEKAEIL